MDHLEKLTEQVLALRKVFLVMPPQRLWGKTPESTFKCTNNEKQKKEIWKKKNKKKTLGPRDTIVIFSKEKNAKKKPWNLDARMSIFWLQSTFADAVQKINDKQEK